MRTTLISIPAPVAVPRGATLAAALAAGLIRGLGLFAASFSVRAVLPESARALPALRLRRRVTEASALRHHAQHLMAADPSFAADLFAAADRHERGE